MGKCIFCSREAKLTGEHIWSAWIARLLAPHVSGFNFSYYDTQTGELREWSQPTMDQKTKLVCKACNEGWMSEVEDSASRTLSGIVRDGSPVCLLTGGIVALAAFSFKCAILATHMAPNEGPFFNPFIRHRFRDSLELPSSVQMWVGHFQGAARWSGRWNVRYVKSSSDSAHDLEFYVFNFVAGRLATQVIAKRWAKLHRRGQELPLVHFEPTWDEALTEFWPNPRRLPIVWPPPKHFVDDSFHDLVDRLSGTATLSFSVNPATHARI
jgi:hypothetical protein